MSERFDPYHKWLGIPPAEQPPNHYRLLGISLFESDPDVITYAADQRMAHVRTFQTGAHSNASQQILNEIAGARIALLNPEKKAAYDAWLRRSVAARVAEPVVAMRPPPPPPSPLPVAAEVPGVPQIQLPDPTMGASAGSLLRPATARRKRSSRNALAAMAVVLLLGGGVVGARYDNGQPMLFATYVDGKRDGVLQYWNPQGQRVFGGQYVKGRNHGLCCLFRNEQPRLVLEHSADRIEMVHLVADGKIQETLDETQALEDAALRAAIAELEDFDRQVKRVENEVRDAAKEAAEKARQEIAAKLNVKKRDAIQSRINRRTLEREAAMKRSMRGGR